jgi:hypothetical protein
MDIAAGDDFLSPCDQKSSYKYVTDIDVNFKQTSVIP